MNLSVVIPTTGKRCWLEPCLNALARAWPTRLVLEVLVVVDGPPSDNLAWLERDFPQCRLIRRPESGGFCAAANTGIAAATGAVIQLLNDDTEVLPGWAEAGLAPFADPSIGAVAPLVRQYRRPDRIDSLGDGYAPFGWAFAHARDESAASWLDHPPFEVLGASASAGFFRASVLHQLQGFEPAFGSYFEDVDLAFRIRWAGLRAVSQPASQVLHHGTGTFRHEDPALVRIMARNAERVFWLNLPLPWLLAMLLPHLGFSLLQVLKAARRGRAHAQAVLLGKGDALRDARFLIQARRRRQRGARLAASAPRFPFHLLPLPSLIRRLSPPDSQHVPTRTVHCSQRKPHMPASQAPAQPAETASQHQGVFT